MRSYSCIIESEAKERQLKIQIFVDLQRCRLQRCLIISYIIVAAFIEIPIHELRTNLL